MSSLRGGEVTLSVFHFATATATGLVDFTSSISAGSSGATKVCFVKALRCLFGAGCEIESVDDGRGLRLLVRVDAAGAVPLVEANMLTLYSRRRVH